MLYSAVGNCWFLNAPGSKIRTSTAIQLKRDNKQHRRPSFVCFVCCFCKLSLVAIVRLQWKEILTFYVIFWVLLLEPNIILRESVQIRSFFWSVFSPIRTEYGEIRLISPYSVRMRKIRTRKNSVFGHFSHSVISDNIKKRWFTSGIFGFHKSKSMFLL